MYPERLVKGYILHDTQVSKSIPLTYHEERELRIVGHVVADQVQYVSTFGKDEE
jgi:hypothetical protein